MQNKEGRYNKNKANKIKSNRLVVLGREDVTSKNVLFDKKSHATDWECDRSVKRE